MPFFPNEVDCFISPALALEMDHNYVETTLICLEYYQMWFFHSFEF